MFFMEGTGHLLREWEYWIKNKDGRIVESGIQKALSPGNCKAMLRVEFSWLSIELGECPLDITVREIKYPGQLQFDFIGGDHG